MLNIEDNLRLSEYWLQNLQHNVHHNIKLRYFKVAKLAIRAFAMLQRASENDRVDLSTASAPQILEFYARRCESFVLSS